MSRSANGPVPGEDRLLELAAGLAAALFVATVLIWAAGEVAGWLSHRAWPPVGLTDAPAVAVSILRHPNDPAAGWPAEARALASPTWAFYAVLVLFLGAAASAVAPVVRFVLGATSAQPMRAMGPVPASLRRQWSTARWQELPVLGRIGVGKLSRLVLGSSEDCVAVVGPPRVGKTLGVLVPQLQIWGGSVVAGSTKPDVLEATAARRFALARRHCGQVVAWAPTAPGFVTGGVSEVGWSPLAGCSDAATCERRVRALVGTSAAGWGARHADHWRENAVRVLRGYFHAAATGKLEVRDVLRWLARNELSEPAIILAGASSVVAGAWAEELQGMERVPAEELGSIFSAARTVLGALQNGNILASCESEHQLDPDRFLLTRSTLYLVAPTVDQDLLAPLAAALVEHLVQRAYELWAADELPARLLLCLDELANTAPLPSLLKILTQGGSQGVNLTWSVQSLAQLRDRYGEQVADAAFSSSRARLVFGGLTDTRDLQAIAQLAGEYEVPSRSYTRGGRAGDRSMTAGTVWRQRLPPSAIRAIAHQRAMLLYHSQDPTLVRVRLPGRRRRLPWLPERLANGCGLRGYG